MTRASRKSTHTRSAHLKHVGARDAAAAGECGACSRLGDRERCVAARSSEKGGRLLLLLLELREVDDEVVDALGVVAHGEHSHLEARELLLIGGRGIARQHRPQVEELRVLRAPTGTEYK